MHRLYLITTKILCVIFITSVLITSGVKAYLFPLAARLPIPGTPSPPGSPWPLPQEWIRSPKLYSIGSDLTYSASVTGCEILNDAFQKRFNYATLLKDGAIQDNKYPVLLKVEVNVPTGEENQCEKYPKLDMNRNYEAYNLTISSSGDEGVAIISAFTVWGALHGLETFSELIWQNSSHFYLNETTISDWPRYPHRGIMIDTARHYVSPNIILEVIRGMSYNKLNVMHWHIVDDQSFPFVSHVFPELSELGAYIPGELIYDRPTIQNIIEVARKHGIRVIFEFDTPGHTLSWGNSHLELLTPCFGDGVNPGTPNYPLHAPFEIIDVTRNSTYEFMEKLFTEIFHDVSKDEFLHLGMDEVYTACWNSSKLIKEFMKEQGYVNLSQVQQHYTEKHLKMIKDIGARAIIWQDPIDFGVEPASDVILQIWKGKESDPNSNDWQTYFQKALDKGYNVLLSSCWYLNYINYGESWKSYYECDPVDSVPTLKPGQDNQILGGEGCLWSEYVDSTNIETRLFPFVSAVAERLWSARNSSTTDDAKWRLDEHRCRMLARGLNVQPIFNGYCSASEHQKPPQDTTEESTTEEISSAGQNYLCSGTLLFCLIFYVLVKN